MAGTKTHYIGDGCASGHPELEERTESRILAIQKAALAPVDTKADVITLQAQLSEAQLQELIALDQVRQMTERIRELETIVGAPLNRGAAMEYRETLLTMVPLMRHLVDRVFPPMVKGSWRYEEEKSRMRDVVTKAEALLGQEATVWE